MAWVENGSVPNCSRKCDNPSFCPSTPVHAVGLRAGAMSLDIGVSRHRLWLNLLFSRSDANHFESGRAFRFSPRAVRAMRKERLMIVIGVTQPTRS